MMINLDKYRSSQEFREILRILQKSSVQQGNMLWQSHDHGKSIITAHHFEIDFVAREVVVLFDSTKNPINPNIPLFVKLEYRGTVFKVSQFRLMQNAVHFSFPEEVKTLELRSEGRHLFNPELEKHVAIRTALSNLKESVNELHFRSIDISPQGLGLSVSEFNRGFLKNNRLLWITRLQDIVLPSAILAEVVYINNSSDQRYVNRKQRELKVGLKLSEEFPLEYYKHFLL